MDRNKGSFASFPSPALSLLPLGPTPQGSPSPQDVFCTSPLSLSQELGVEVAVGETEALSCLSCAVFLTGVFSV